MKLEPTVGLNEGYKVKRRVVDEYKIFGWSNWKDRVAIWRKWEDYRFQGSRFWGEDQELSFGYTGFEMAIRYLIEMISKILEMNEWAQVGGKNLGAVSTRIHAFHHCTHCLLCYAVCNLDKNCVCDTLEL